MPHRRQAWQRITGSQPISSVSITRKAIDMEQDATDEQLEEFVKANYQLVLLTPHEAHALTIQSCLEFI
jgi:hypothetical protein